jgi:hypothetical protein
MAIMLSVVDPVVLVVVDVGLLMLLPPQPAINIAPAKKIKTK